MTNRFPLYALAAATLVITACNQEDHTIVQQGPPDPMANELKNAPPVELPAPIAASKTYRCDGNQVVEIDWTERDGKPAGANIRVGAEAIAPVVLTAAPEGTGPFTAPDGTSLTGTKDAGTVRLTLPGKGAISCRA